MRKKKNKLFWFTVVAVLLCAIISAFIILTPRIVNTDSVRQSIERAISKKLGGTLTYDRVELSILPLPRIVIYKPNIDVPQSISGSLESLDIYPEVLPLLSGKLQIAKAVIKRPEITVILAKETGEQREEEAEEKEETKKGPPLETVLETAAHIIPHILLIIEQGQLIVMENRRTVFVLKDLKTRIAFESKQQSGDSRQPAGRQDTFRISGSAAFTVSEGGPFPGAARLAIEKFELLPATLSFSQVRIELLDSSLTLSGRLDDYLATKRTADLSIGGTIGPDAVQWIRTEAGLPSSLTVAAPVTVSKARLRLNRTGSTRLEGSATVAGGAALSVDIAWASKSISIKEVRIRDGESDARIAFKREPRVLDFSFRGNLTKATLNRFFEHENIQFGWIKGDVSAHVDYDKPETSTMKGLVDGEGLVIPYISRIPFIVDRITLKASGNRILLDPVSLRIGNDRLTANGSITVSEDALNLDMDLASARFDWETMQALLTPERDKQQEKRETSGGRRKLPVRGQLRISLDAISAGRLTARELQAGVTLERDRTRIELSKATLCGVSLPGTITIVPDDIRLDFRPYAKDQELGPAIACFSGEDFRLSGLFDLSGHLAMDGTKDTFARSLQGTVSFSAKDGRVYRDIVIMRVLSFLTVSELFKGNYSKLEKEGLPYNSFTLRADIKDADFSIQEAVLKSKVTNMTGSGTLDLRGKTMSLKVWVAPFTNVDAVVENAPLVGNILGGSLVTIPVRITGPFSNPEVKVLK